MLSSSDSFGDRWLIVRASYDTRPVIERSSYDFNVSADDRPIIDRPSDDYRAIIARCPPMAHRLPVANLSFVNTCRPGTVDDRPGARGRPETTPITRRSFHFFSPMLRRRRNPPMSRYRTATGVNVTEV